MAAIFKALRSKGNKRNAKVAAENARRAEEDDDHFKLPSAVQNPDEIPEGISERVFKAFQKCDRDGSEKIGAEELVVCFEELGRGASVWQAKKLIAECGPLINASPELMDSAGRCNAIDVFGFSKLMATLEIFQPTEPFLEHSILGHDRPLPYQRLVRTVYTSNKAVFGVALIIIANFVINIVEKEIDADVNNPQYTALWEGLDVLFNYLFLIELLVNMYGFGFGGAFWRSGWNVFDFIIVAVGILLMTGVDLGSMSKLKLLRAFRVFRLFKRIKSLNQIIMALLSAVPGVSNAFLILFIFFCIYSILAVELFRDFGANGTYTVNDLGDACRQTMVVNENVADISRINRDGECSHINDAYTPRGYTAGIEYYGTYSRAMFSMFQVMTGDSWAEGAGTGRPLTFGLYQKSTFTVGMFFVSFVILTNMVLTQVVVAVLLDKFVAPPPAGMPDKDVLDLIQFVKAEQYAVRAVRAMKHYVLARALRSWIDARTPSALAGKNHHEGDEDEEPEPELRVEPPPPTTRSAKEFLMMHMQEVVPKETPNQAFLRRVNSLEHSLLRFEEQLKQLLAHKAKLKV